jgi:hypothetical protein
MSLRIVSPDCMLAPAEQSGGGTQLAVAIAIGQQRRDFRAQFGVAPDAAPARSGVMAGPPACE